MKKLIAQRPILYMGRTYERGSTLPAHDPKMVAAWLRAGSAAWSGQENHQNAPDVEGGQDTEDGKDATLSGNLDMEKLERMKKEDLLKLAEEKGVDISGAKNNHDRALLIAAAGAPNDGNAPPEPGAGDIVQ